MSDATKTILNNFEKYLFDTAKNYLLPSKIEELSKEFLEESRKYPVKQSSFANLRRILDSLYNKFSFFSDALRYRHHIEILFAISFNSNYLTDIVVRNPEFLYQLFDQYYLQKRLNPEKLREEIDYSLTNYKSFQAKINYLRHLKRRYTLKIGVYDILQIGELTYVTEHISSLASAISAALFDICFNEVLNNYEITPPETNFTMIALGKMGGNELNYSSDIDLMFIIGENYILQGKKQLEYDEVFQEAIQLFVKTSNDVSMHGFIYRVDLRLRPDGLPSPLARTLHDTIFYYETRGEAWERQMLIKANFVAGDKHLFDKFINAVLPFIYPKSFMESPVTQIAKMRNNVENSANSADDIKKSMGGIRDVEFLVQMLQLLNAGSNKELQTGNTIHALNLLGKHNLISKEETDFLLSSYIFYRRIEHYLQLMNNTQTHDIPQESELLTKLSFFMGFRDVKDFNKAVNDYKIKTRSIYNHYVAEKENSNKNESLDSVQFLDGPRAKQNIRYLRSGAGLLGKKEFNSRTMELFNQLEKEIVSYLQKSKNPDLVLENFHTVIKSSGTQSIWYSELRNKQLLHDVLYLCEFSKRFVDNISSNPRMSDFFFSGNIYVKDITTLFDNITVNELLLIVTVQLCLRLINREKFSKLTGDFLEYTVAHLAEKYFSGHKYFIAGLGSFGMKQMSYSSDIDLIIVVDGMETTGDIQEECENFITETNKCIAPFTIDFKLRPEGRNAPIVADLNAYKKYLDNRAEFWEFQALLKLSFVDGSEESFNKFREHTIIAYENFNKDNISQKMLNMHKRIINEKSGVLNKSINIKFKHGGLMTVEYIVDLFIMNDAKLYKSFLGKNYDYKFTHLNKFEKDIAENLLKNYHMLKEIEIIFQSYSNYNKSTLPTDIDKNIHLLHCFKEMLNIDLKNELAAIFTYNSRVFQKLQK